MGFQIIFVITSFIVYAGPAQADTLDEHLAKMKSVIQKDGRCEFAVVALPKDKSDEHFFPRAVVCVGMVVLDEGTMKERKGCTAFYLNTYELYTMPLMQAYGYNMAENKACNADGFEAVMNELLFTHFTDGPSNPGYKIPVKAAFFYPYQLSGEEMKVLLDGQPKYRQWYDKERSTYMAQEQAKDKAEKAKEAAIRKAEQATEKKSKAKDESDAKNREDLWN
jgi:hypothetical protein